MKEALSEYLSEIKTKMSIRAFQLEWLSKHLKCKVARLFRKDINWKVGWLSTVLSLGIALSLTIIAPFSVNQAEMLLDSLIGIQTTAFTILFSAAFISMQFSSTRYSEKFMKLLVASPLFIFTLLIILGSIGSNLSISYLISQMSPNSSRKMFFLSLFMTSFSFSILSNFVWFSVRNFSPDKILKEFEKSLSPENYLYLAFRDTSYPIHFQHPLEPLHRFIAKSIDEGRILDAEKGMKLFFEITKDVSDFIESKEIIPLRNSPAPDFHADHIFEPPYEDYVPKLASRCYESNEEKLLENLIEEISTILILTRDKYDQSIQRQADTGLLKIVKEIDNLDIHYKVQEERNKVTRLQAKFLEFEPSLEEFDSRTPYSLDKKELLKVIETIKTINERFRKHNQFISEISFGKNKDKNSEILASHLKMAEIVCSSYESKYGDFLSSTGKNALGFDMKREPSRAHILLSINNGKRTYEHVLRKSLELMISSDKEISKTKLYSSISSFYKVFSDSDKEEEYYFKKIFNRTLEFFILAYIVTDDEFWREKLKILSTHERFRKNLEGIYESVYANDYGYKFNLSPVMDQLSENSYFGYEANSLYTKDEFAQFLEKFVDDAKVETIQEKYDDFEA